MPRHHPGNFKPWTPGEGRAFARRLGRELAPHYAIALTGGTLTHVRGERKDVDVIVYPMKNARWDLDEIRGLLRAAGLEPLLSADQMRRHWRRRGVGDLDGRHVEVWRTGDRRRVDVLYFDGRAGSRDTAP